MAPISHFNASGCSLAIGAKPGKLYEVTLGCVVVQLGSPVG